MAISPFWSITQRVMQCLDRGQLTADDLLRLDNVLEVLETVPEGVRMWDI